MPSESSTAVDTGLGINQTYGIGSFDGDAYRDTVTFRGEQGPLSANGQLIGRATSQDTFDGLDGILGLGPASQASRALYNKATGEHITRQIATVTDTLFLEEKIGENVVSIGFRPIQSSDQLGTDGGFPIAKAAGTLTFGGANLDETAGPIE
jgi:cathepsin E